jgi:DNA-binding MarR family transcriptional regulator
MDDLRRDLQVEEVPLRVALSLLEQVGLLRRWPDIPRSVTLRLVRGTESDDPHFAAFCAAARLQPRQSVERDLLEVAKATGQDAGTMEERVLEWQDAGLLECRASARDVHVELLPPPAEARQRLHDLLEQYEQIQRQRIAEIVAYARTTRCRHGHISAYLGGRKIERCQSCDNCVPAPAAKAKPELPDESSQLRSVLEAAAHGWGARNLALILRGRPEAPSSAKNQPGYGALAFRSKAAIARMVESLTGAGLLKKQQLSHGGVMVELTPEGRKALRDALVLEAVVKKSAWQAGAPGDASAVPDGDPLLQRLRAWRLEKAREQGVAAFIVAHDSLLRRIVAAKPRSESELRAVKGMGPRKMEKYGAELLSLLYEQGEG